MPRGSPPTGEMAAALAHELNQPLTAAISFARACQAVLDQCGRRARGARRAAALIDQAVEQALRAGEIIRSTREFLRRGDPRRARVEVPRDVRGRFDLVARRSGAQRASASPSRWRQACPPVFADAIQIEQVLLNLVRNSIEAMAPRRRGTADRLVARRPARTSPAFVEFGVRDSGPGFAPEIADRLFTPFATTKERGMGLGLSISRSIVEAHGGRIWAVAVAGRGRRVPLHPAGLSADDGEPAMPDATVFIVDDDEAVRDALRRAARRQGLRGRDASTPPKRSSPRPPPEPHGCLVVDVRMPGMSGLELQRELKRPRHALPVIVITGHGDVPMAVEAIKAGAVDFLEKPFDADALLAASTRRSRRDRGAAPGRRRPRGARPARRAQLTAREREVMDLVVAGLPTRSIAHRLGIAVRTVEIHRARVMEKTGRPQPVGAGAHGDPPRRAARIDRLRR